MVLYVTFKCRKKTQKFKVKLIHTRFTHYDIYTKIHLKPICRSVIGPLLFLS